MQPSPLKPSRLTLGALTLGACLALSSPAATAAQDTSSGVADSSASARPLLVGARVPEAGVHGLDGTELQLSELLEGRRSILIFYRGGW